MNLSLAGRRVKNTETAPLDTCFMTRFITRMNYKSNSS